jgi:hypothetical protein
MKMVHIPTNHNVLPAPDRHVSCFMFRKTTGRFSGTRERNVRLKSGEYENTLGPPNDPILGLRLSRAPYRPLTKPTPTLRADLKLPLLALVATPQTLK